MAVGTEGRTLCPHPPLCACPQKRLIIVGRDADLIVLALCALDYSTITILRGWFWINVTTILQEMQSWTGCSALWCPALSEPRRTSVERLDRRFRRPVPRRRFQSVLALRLAITPRRLVPRRRCSVFGGIGPLVAPPPPPAPVRTALDGSQWPLDASQKRPRYIFFTASQDLYVSKGDPMQSVARQI